jgi:hypothetical protein
MVELAGPLTARPSNRGQVVGWPGTRSFRRTNIRFLPGSGSTQAHHRIRLRGSATTDGDAFLSGRARTERRYATTTLRSAGALPQHHLTIDRDRIARPGRNGELGRKLAHALQR